MNVGILLFDDVQVTDFTGPFDVFLVASRVGQDAEPRFNIFTLAAATEVRCAGGLVVKVDHGLNEHPPIDLLVVPGGNGTRREENNADLIDWIKTTAEATEITASVCTGARLMAKTGLWNGLEVTTHWNSIEYLRDTFPTLIVVEGVRYVDAGKFVSSAGITAGFDLALHLVERLHGIEHANLTARLLEYDYWEGYSRSSTPVAP
jgi:transcriptional regulator GlxA family with amidase domain